MKTIIISDLHLKFSENMDDRKRRERVIKFLESLKGNTDKLILNGDIFDLWFAWNSVIIRGYFRFLRLLAELNESGCELILLKGNHDFWFNDFLTEEIGLKVFDRYEFESSNKKILVLHGDQYTKNDFRYLIFRFIIRTPLLKKIFSIIHPEISLNIGKLLSRSSRERKKKVKIEQIKEAGLIEYAKSQFSKFDYVIMGHTHNPIKLQFENGIYLNSGDWIMHDSYIEIIDDKFELIISKGS